MNSNQDIAISVHFQKVAMKGIEPQATHGKGRVVLKLFQVFWIAQTDQSLDHQIKAQNLKCRRFVLGQSVVHIKSIKLDLLQVETAIHENPEKINVI